MTIDFYFEKIYKSEIVTNYSYLLMNCKICFIIFFIEFQVSKPIIQNRT